LKKVFENIAKLEFDGENKIHAMYSGEGERVPFIYFINPTNNYVEFWMGEVEEMMRKSVRQQLRDSILEYSKIPRSEWVLR